MRGFAKLPASIAAVSLCAGVIISSAAQASTYSAVQASGSEFRIGLSRHQVKPGKLRVEFVNFGEDDHDLAILRKRTGSVRRLDIVKPGENASITMPVRKGSYVLWCTISDHKAKGMRAVLRVKR